MDWDRKLLLVPNWRVLIADYEPLIIFQFLCMHCQDKCNYMIFPILLILSQNLIFRFFWKRPIFSKSTIHRALGPTFLDSSHHFWSKSSFFWQKNIFFIFFFPGENFLPFFHHHPSKRGVAAKTRIAPIILTKPRSAFLYTSWNILLLYNNPLTWALFFLP